MPNREFLIAAGWKQGVLLSPNEQLTEGARYEINEGCLLLIISQTCDLIQGSFETEPYFEVLCIHPLDREPNGGYQAGKNSRRLEFTLNVGGVGESNWYALPYERHLIDRGLLLSDLSPDNFLNDGQSLKMILRWMARRYTRIAFPEDFINRIEGRKSQIGKKFQRLNPTVSNVYIKLEPFDELISGQEYNVELLLVMDAVNFDTPSLYGECLDIKNQIEYQLNQCDDINVVDINLESKASITIEDLEGFREWDYSYLSFREPDNAAEPIEL